jgi:hypothetical protein
MTVLRAKGLTLLGKAVQRSFKKNYGQHDFIQKNHLAVQ